MTEPIVPIQDVPMTRFQRHKFLVMVGGTIVISLVLVSAALTLYATSGTEQLDLSRPGYQGISKQAVSKQDFDSFSSEGPLNKQVAKQFENTYDVQVKKLTTVQAFGGDPIGATIPSN